MFGSLLRQITHRRTFTPLYMQTRTNTYKREVVSDDLDFEEYNKKLESLKNDVQEGKDMVWSKYDSSIYDDKMIDEFLKNNERED